MLHRPKIIINRAKSANLPVTKKRNKSHQRSQSDMTMIKKKVTHTPKRASLASNSVSNKVVLDINRNGITKRHKKSHSSITPKKSKHKLKDRTAKLKRQRSRSFDNIDKSTNIKIDKDLLDKMARDLRTDDKTNPTKTKRKKRIKTKHGSMEVKSNRAAANVIKTKSPKKPKHKDKGKDSKLMHKGACSMDIAGSKDNVDVNLLDKMTKDLTNDIKLERKGKRKKKKRKKSKTNHSLNVKSNGNDIKLGKFENGKIKNKTKRKKKKRNKSKTNKNIKYEEMDNESKKKRKSSGKSRLKRIKSNEGNFKYEKLDKQRICDDDTESE